VSYVEKNLAPGEKILLRARYHWIRFVSGGGTVLAGIVLFASSFVVPEGSGPGFGNPLRLAGLAVVLAGLGMIGWRALVDSFDEYAITSFRVVCKRGFVTRTVRQIPLDKIQDVNLHATFWGRWLAFGDVEIQTAGADGTVVFPHIFQPEQFRNVLFAHLQDRSGLAAASMVAAAAPRPVSERMAELEKVRKEGLVSEDEYRVKREALLKEL
jgi:uncharacterized membrane protein YdbT with pleckstrin-like domain